jgi:hypothetical protein
MSVREKLRAAKPGASEREIDSLIGVGRGLAPVQWERSAFGAQIGMRLWQAFPQAMARFAKPGDVPARTAYRALAMASDPDKNAEFAKMCGGTGRESREEVEATLVRDLGFDSVRSLRQGLFGHFQAAEAADLAIVRLEEGTLDKRIGSGRADQALPDLTEREKLKRDDESEFRAMLEKAYDRAEAEKSPVKRAKSASYDAPDETSVDVARAYAAHHGEAPDIDYESHGAREWAKRHGQEKELAGLVAEKRVAETSEIAGNVERQRSTAAAIEGSRAGTAVGAQAMVEGLTQDEVRGIERQFDNGEGA